MIDQAAECAAYFSKNPGYKRVMEQLFRLHQRYGRVAGVVRLPDATSVERDALRSLFGRSFSGEVKFKAQEFDAALQESRFCGVSLKSVLEAYFHKPIHTNKEIRAKKEQQFERLLQAAHKVARSDTCRQWLSALEAKSMDRGYLLLRKEMEKNFDTAETALCKAIWSMDELENQPKEDLRLAVFSAFVTMDPHALDSDVLCGQLFLHLLASRLNRPYPSSAEERDALYFENRILCDSISSTVTQIGLILKDGPTEHPAFMEFRQRHECCTMSLTNLNSLVSASSPTGRAYLVENQMLFSQLCDQAVRFHSPLICTSGQLQVAVLRLLDMLADSGTTLFYAGDFDGGGISIAARLLNRYPDHLRLWHMSVQDYEQCKSQNRLSDKSRHLLRAADRTSLELLANAVQAANYAGYQELLLEQLLVDLTTPIASSVLTACVQ